MCKGKHFSVTIGQEWTRADKSGQGSRQSGFILASEKEVLWHHVALECEGVCRASVPKFNPHRHSQVVGLKRQRLPSSVSLLVQEELRDSLS